MQSQLSHCMVYNLCYMCSERTSFKQLMCVHVLTVLNDLTVAFWKSFKPFDLYLPLLYYSIVVLQNLDNLLYKDFYHLSV